MIKVATVFSGIGSFEYSLKRLGIEHEISFACDNGGVLIDIDYEKEFENVKNLDSIVEKKQYVDLLYSTNSKKTNFVKQTYLANHEMDDNHFFQDIRLLDGNDFNNKIDIFVGGSPCQSFSSVGFQRGLEDARGTLFYDYARLVDEIQPKVFIFENVYGLYRHDKGNTWKVITEIFDSLGYHYKAYILNSRDFGIPQNRKRLFVIGFKDFNSYFNFQEPITKKLNFTMHDILESNIKDGDLVNFDNFNKSKSNVDEKYYLTPKLQAYVMSSGTKTFFSKPVIDLEVARTVLSTMGNRHRAGVDNYVTENGRIRMLTEREALRLMGYGDDFKIVVSRAQAYKQAGNSIVVSIFDAINKNLIESLK